MAKANERATPYRHPSLLEDRTALPPSTAGRDAVVLLCLVAILASIGSWGEIVDTVATFVMGVRPPK